MNLKNFSDCYNLNTRIIGKESEQNGLLETYGKDIIKVKKINQTNPKTLWTLIDDDSSDNVLVIAGMHFVNRIAYLVTKEEWTDENECYLDK